MSNNLLLIDADVICYQFAWRNEHPVDWDGDGEIDIITHPEKALSDIHEWLDALQEKLNANEVMLILSDRTRNFRKELEPTYKENRASNSKPELWYHLREYLENGDHGIQSKVYSRLEGDDVLGIMATHPAHRDRAIMVSIDKDMQTIPGRLYLYNKPELGLRTITPLEAHRFHMRQTLWGDSVDGYKGCPRIGEKRSEDLVNSSDDPMELWGIVVDTFESKDLTEEDAIHQARLAHILHHCDYTLQSRIKLWTPQRIMRYMQYA